jgi:hypothetical protein
MCFLSRVLASYYRVVAMNAVAYISPGTKYGDVRLDWKVRSKTGEERPLFSVTDDQGTLHIRSADY